MIRVVVGGATGKLGRLVCELVRSQPDMELVGGVVSPGSESVGRPIATGVDLMGADRLKEAVAGADVYVDLTSPAAAEANLPAMRRKGLNLVIGTTGMQAASMSALASSVREDGTAAVVTPNFSVGVNVFFKTCESLARTLPGYDVEIVEVHHDLKKDAPSGTARRAAEIVAGATGTDRFVYGREGNVGARGREIGIHSVRAGDVVGEHTVIFAGRKERLELTHRAHSREAFAEGCVMAIRWVAGRNDGKVHSMDEVLGI
ncbi:MAG: 4-hydroxy-tetrahydrodipicolinate reductase [Methanomassiliicoccus sp.]|nr:4-hydroxy-tetrahydrodipicolinate reductase [Methanomassiliicoccus sp.]